ncbi:MAG: hypothetical protein Fues2KO_07690 [Fuerstiella sp.]
MTNRPGKEFQDSGSAADSRPKSPAEECAGLRRTATNATHRLSVSQPAELSAAVRHQLQELCRRVGSIDAHLFRICLRDTASGFLGLRYHAALAATDRELKTVRRFSLQLIPKPVQDALLAGNSALLRTDSGSGGRLLTALMQQMKSRTYLLVPIKLGDRLQGMLGIAWQQDREVSKLPEYLELLKLNGAILLGHVIQVRRERRRSRELRRWRKIANHACDFAFRVDHRDMIVGTTPFGMSQKTPSLNGLRLTDVVTRSFQRQVNREIARSVSEREVRTYVFQLCLGHQGPRWYLARIEPASAQASYKATLYLTDNNADKVLQEENRELTEKLLQASRMGLLGQMSSEFAHQLNQPLQAILNYCNTMQRRIRKGTDTQENSTNSLAKMEKSVLHAASIIKQIRDFIRFRQLHIVKTDVGTMLDDAVMMVSATARNCNVDLLVDIDHADRMVCVDRTQTTHVFVNILVNAVQACVEAGTHRPLIRISSRLSSMNDHVIVSVEDNGPGLPKSNSDKVFTKFYSTKEDGLGLGLAISRDVIEAQGGRLSAANNEQGGCTFNVALRLEPDSGLDTTELREIPDINPDYD